MAKIMPAATAEATVRGFGDFDIYSFNSDGELNKNGNTVSTHYRVYFSSVVSSRRPGRNHRGIIIIIIIVIDPRRGAFTCGFRPGKQA